MYQATQGSDFGHQLCKIDVWDFRIEPFSYPATLQGSGMTWSWNRYLCCSRPRQQAHGYSQEGNSGWVCAFSFVHDFNGATPLKDMLLLLIITKLYETLGDCRTSRRHRSTSQGVEAISILNPSQLFELQMVGQMWPMRGGFSLTSVFCSSSCQRSSFSFRWHQGGNICN